MQQAIKGRRIFMRTICAESQITGFLSKLVIWRHGLAGSNYPKTFGQGVNVGLVCWFMLCVLSQFRRNIVSRANPFVFSCYWFFVWIIHKAKVTDDWFSCVKKKITGVYVSMPFSFGMQFSERRSDNLEFA